MKAINDRKCRVRFLVHQRIDKSHADRAATNHEVIAINIFHNTTLLKMPRPIPVNLISIKA